MASEISTYLTNAVLAWIKGGAMPTAPTAVYMSLHNGDCGPDGTSGTDVTTTVRVAGRVEVTFGAVAARKMSNDAIVDFGNSAGAVTVNSAAFWTDAVADECLGASLLPAPLEITVDLPVKVPVGNASFGFPIA